ncbi:hypothetical protein BN1263540065 [Stenotrophomonas indicatrix]|nr:hypothetical protein BN1263540065 [Stenotrophomonas indicatrix]
MARCAAWPERKASTHGVDLLEWHPRVAWIYWSGIHAWRDLLEWHPRVAWIYWNGIHAWRGSAGAASTRGVDLLERYSGVTLSAVQHRVACTGGIPITPRRRYCGVAHAGSPP